MIEKSINFEREAQPRRAEQEEAFDAEFVGEVSGERWRELRECAALMYPCDSHVGVALS